MDRESQKRESLLVAAEAQTITDASPGLDDLKSELVGAQDHTNPATGERRIYHRHPGLTAAENEANGRRMSEMMAGRMRVSREVAYAREARRDMVAVRDSRGAVRLVPPDVEDKADKKGFKPVRRWGRPSFRKRESEYRREMRDAANQG